MIQHDDPLCTLYLGDCVEVMRELPAESVDAVVTDPPYGLEFMGKEWDRLGDIGKTSHAGPREHDPATVFSRQRVAYSGSSNRKCRVCRKWEWDYPDRKCICEAPDFPNVRAHQSRIMGEWHEAWAREAFRVAKPGAHLLAFGGTRTVHRLAAAIEDAGWEIRDMLIWGYGSGFPKSSRVNRDPRFCQCAATERSDESIDPEPETDARTRTVEPSGRAAGGWRSGGNGTHAVLDSQDRYWHDHGRDGGLPPPVEADAPASAPLPAGALGRSRSAAPEDDGVPGSSRTPSPARRSARPSSQGSTRPADVPASTQSGRLGSTERGPSTGSDTAESDAGTARSSEVLSAWPHCKACGKPDANGYGSALKPAFEPIVMARKPLQGTIAGNVYKHGTGALNIDATRIGTEKDVPASPRKAQDRIFGRYEAQNGSESGHDPNLGRWPANLLLTDPIFDGDTPGVVGGGAQASQQIRSDYSGTRDLFGATFGGGHGLEYLGDSGTYSRFFKLQEGTGCYLCGRARSADGDTSPERTRPASARSPAPTGASSDAATTTGSPTTNGTEQTSWHDGSESMPPTPRSKRRGTSPASEPPSSPARSRDAASPEIGTTTTMGDRWMCDTCAVLTTSAITFEPGDTRFLLIPKSSRSDREPLVRGCLHEWQPAGLILGVMHYVCKVCKKRTSDPQPGVQERPWQGQMPVNDPDYLRADGVARSQNIPRANSHPTVKPLDLMRHLVRLVTPPGGTVLDPFLGSGTTAIAANAEGFRCIGIEKEREYLEITLARMTHQPLGMQL